MTSADPQWRSLRRQADASADGGAKGGDQGEAGVTGSLILASTVACASSAANRCASKIEQGQNTAPRISHGSDPCVPAVFCVNVRFAICRKSRKRKTTKGVRWWARQGLNL